MADSEVRLLTPAQVADLVGVKPGTVRDWIRGGILKAVDVRTGNRREPAYRVTESDLAEWIEARKR